jgi:hypothetical protein
LGPYSAVLANSESSRQLFRTVTPPAPIMVIARKSESDHFYYTGTDRLIGANYAPVRL